MAEDVVLGVLREVDLPVDGAAVAVAVEDCHVCLLVCLFVWFLRLDWEDV